MPASSGTERCGRRLQLGATTQRWVPTMLTMATDREDPRGPRFNCNRATTLLDARQNLRVASRALRHAKRLSRYSALAVGQEPRFSPCEGYELRRYGSASPTAC